MDSEPNPNNPRVSFSESEPVPPATIQRQPSLQGRSEAQIPFVSSTEAHDTIPPSPDDVFNKPALWQLGRHSYYKSSTGYHQQSTSFGGRPIVEFTEGDGRGGPGYPPHQVNKV